MMDSKMFWISQAGATLAFHIVGLALLITEGSGHWVAKIWLAILVIHIGEIFIARAVLKDKQIPIGTVAVKTLLFGFTWWLPRQRGVFQS